MHTDQLIRQLREAGGGSAVIPTELECRFRPRILRRGEALLPFHTVCRRYYFVNKGALRIFYTRNGQEYTSWFAFENYFFTELESYTRQNVSRYCIAAMEESEVLEITKKDMNDLLSRYDWWTDFVLRSQQQTIIKLTDHICSFQTETAAQRYEKLFPHPDFIQRTSQKDLSSMIGITRYSLSRIRKK